MTLDRRTGRVFSGRAVAINAPPAMLLVVVLSIARGPATGFLYDAAQYWAAPMALVGGGDAVQAGALSVRGVLSTIIYLPPALLATFLGPATAGLVVLAWNAIAAAVVCVFLFPRFAALVAPGNEVVRIWLSAAVGGILLSGYAPFPLLDTWTVFAGLAGLYGLARGQRWWLIVLSGVALAVSINLRPSAAVPLAIATIVLLCVAPRRIVLVAAGIAVAVVPQFVLNLVRFGYVGLVPYGTSFLARVQASQATYGIRYDTILNEDRNPQQWFCDPVYSAIVAHDAPPSDQLGVVLSVIHHLPFSLWFLIEKVAASLHWSFATPYAHDPDGSTSLMTPLVLAVTAIGVVVLVIRAVQSRGDRSRFVLTLAALGFWFGSVVTVALSTPETRFALPLVTVGLIGLLAAVPEVRMIRISRPFVVGVTASVLLAAVLFGAGRFALSHPMAAGPLKSASTCVP